MMKNIGIWLVVGLIFMTVLGQMDKNRTASDTVSYSEFMERAQSGQIESATIQGQKIIWVDKDKKRHTTNTVGDMWMVSDLLKYHIRVEGIPPEEPGLFMMFLMSWGPTLFFIGIMIYFMRSMQGGGKGGIGQFGKSRATTGEVPNVTFADVAGCDEAKFEVAEVVEFMRNPTKFQKLGGRIPRGVLMVGSPGTGKTLLAKAVAGEAKVPFFSTDGSSFVEMFVGVGSARVRDLFEQAKKNAPCIIFIDEIDAVGKRRGNGIGGGGNDEREQTLNSILVEMDGFETSQLPVIVFAATNRADVLDPALLRPGRFDRQVHIPLPDIRGREQILLVHMRKVPVDPDVQADIIARGTPGFSGADLANLVNEAALFAARRSGRFVTMQDFEQAKDKIIMGTERKLVMPEEERRNTAYHESGHALVGKLLPKCHPVHKVTIIPRGGALGVTMSLPEFDSFTHGKEFLLSQISMLFGGRIAEEVFMGQMTTGASSDFERATQIARNMVTKWGMSDALGLTVHTEHEGVFGGTKNVSEDTMRRVDDEIERILREQYNVARKLIEENRDKMEAMTKALLEWETIDADQINDIMAGLPPRPPKVVVVPPPTPPETPPSTGAAVEPKTDGNPDIKKLVLDQGDSDKKNK